MSKLELSLHEKQGQALRCPANEILYGGAAGGGKSHLMRAAAITYCMAVPGLQAVIFRRYMPDLKKNHMEGPKSFPVLLQPLVESGHCVILQKEIRFFNGSRISLAHLEHAKDMFRWQGAEIHLLLMDELTHFTQEMYRFLRGRCRMVGINPPPGLKAKFPLIICGSNPGGIGHVWVKKTFVNNGGYLIKKTAKSEGGMLRCYIPARLDDNPSLMKDDPDYENRLEGLGDKMLVRAMREGDWSIVAGAMFGDTWRTPQHTCKHFPIPAEWAVWRGADDGYAAPAAVLWFAQDPDTKTIYVIDELYKMGMLPDVMTQKVRTKDANVRRIDSDGTVYRNNTALSGILDAAAFGDTGQQNAIPRGLVMNQLGGKWTACEKWAGSRIAGCQHVHRMLAINPRTGRPYLQFFDTCENAIEILPSLPRDPKEPEDVDTDAEDHIYDALRYGLQWKKSGWTRKKMMGV